MTNYFELYKNILQVINDDSPSNGTEFFNALSKNQYIKDKFANNDAPTVDDTLLVLDDLIKDGLVNGHIIQTKDHSVYELTGLSTAGHEHLLKTSEKSFSEKLVKHLKENGIPVTAQNVSKLVANLFL